jgi:hypothetical protein
MLELSGGYRGLTAELPRLGISGGYGGLTAEILRIQVTWQGRHLDCIFAIAALG